MDQNLREFAESLQNELIENIRLRSQIENLYNYLQSLLDNSPDRIFDLNRDGTIYFMSRDLSRGRNLVSPEVKGKNIGEFIDPENQQIVAAQWEQFDEGKFEQFELVSRAKDGTKRHLLITPRPIAGTDRYLLVQRDITEFKQLREKVYESEKLAAVGQLAAGIAHEVRNPLSSIKMSLQILEKRMHPEGNDLKRFQIAQREVERLEQLVNDVLIYARPAALQAKPCDVHRIVEHVLAMAEKGIADKNIVVQTRFEDHLPMLMADADMLEQAFLNICRNALDAMQDGGRLRIAARRTDDGTALEVEVEDNGCGIDEKDKAHIFNPFFTTKSSGTGLGLTPVQKIVELHRGSIEILSKKGEGTRAIVTLPFDATGGEAPPQQPAAG
jgi:PAS domain S-box-containing protein